MKLKAYWSALPRFAKIAFFLSITLGVALLVLGVKGDSSRFWDERGFLANITTSLVGALFGVPLAVVVIGWFTASHSSRIQSAATTQLAHTAWQQFGESVIACTPPAITNSLISESTAIALSYSEIKRVVSQARAVSTPDYKYLHRRVPDWSLNSNADTTEGQVREQAAAALDELRTATALLRGAVGYPAEYQRDWAVLSARWAFLSSNVRVLRYSSGSPWIPVQFESVFDHLVRDQGSPLPSVDYALGLLEKMIAYIDRELQGGYSRTLSLFESAGSEFYFDPDDLASRAKIAHDHLVEIRNATLDPEASDWART